MPIITPVRQRVPFAHEMRDFWRFVRMPAPSPRSPGRVSGAAPVNGWQADWSGGISFRRLFQWALALWAINMFVLGPVAVGAAGLGGSGHRMDISNVPWLTALIWAPIAEELAFRYGLRRPVQALWFVPVTLFVVIMGPQGWTIGLLILALFVAWRGILRAPPYMGDTLWRRDYSRRFGLAFHLSALGFAGMHLNNFTLGTTPYWLMPALVLPQYLTGLVLGWMRVRRGIGAAIALHALFNAGPLLLVWLIVTYLPEAATLAN